MGFSLHDYMEMHGQQNIKLKRSFASSYCTQTRATKLAHYNALIKPSLHNIYNKSCNYYNYSTKQYVSALFGHHQAYKIVVLVKVHSVVFTYGISWFTIVLSIFFELQVLLYYCSIVNHGIP